MAINDSCIVMLVGHGAISNYDLITLMNTKIILTASNIGGYKLIYPVPPGDSLDRFGHNSLLYNLGNILDPVAELK